MANSKYKEAEEIENKLTTCPLHLYDEYNAKRKILYKEAFEQYKLLIRMSPENPEILKKIRIISRKLGF